MKEHDRKQNTVSSSKKKFSPVDIYKTSTKISPSPMKQTNLVSKPSYS